MDRLPENMFLLTLKQDHLSTEIKKVSGPTLPSLSFKNSNKFTPSQQKRPSHTTVVPGFRDTCAPTSRKYVSTERKT